MFSEVLKLCKAAGLTSLGQIAIDGTKIGSDAALDQNRDAAWIAAEIDKILAEAGAVDAEEQTAPRLFDAPLPEKLRSRSGRLQRLKAALAEVQAAEQAAANEQEERDEKAARAAEEGRRLRGRKPKDPRAALSRAQADAAALRLRVSAEPAREDLRVALEAAERRVVTAEQAGEALIDSRVSRSTKVAPELTSNSLLSRIHQLR
ncbi:MAG TPA: hypothetical protein VMD59_16485 [Acidimicrobiales bacterium]|nr:hypothetical protein [Acidimicrobiales bacterium]